MPVTFEQEEKKRPDDDEMQKKSESVQNEISSAKDRLIKILTLLLTYFILIFSVYKIWKNPKVLKFLIFSDNTSSNLFYLNVGLFMILCALSGFILSIVISSLLYAIFQAFESKNRKSKSWSSTNENELGPASGDTKTTGASKGQKSSALHRMKMLSREKSKN